MADKQYRYAIGRRKTSSAAVRLFPSGNGTFTVKDGDKEVSLQQYFVGHAYLIENALSPFAILGDKAEKRYNAEITVSWGGIMGQAEAIRLAFSRALVAHNEWYRVQLKPYDLLKRDARIKERKKPGLKKARKSPQWSKR